MFGFHTTMHVKVFCLLTFLRGVSHVEGYGQSPKVVIIEPSDGVIKEGEWFTLKCLYKSKFVKANWYKNSYYEDKVSGIAVSETGGFYQCQRDDWWRYHTRSERLEVVTIASDETLTVQFRSRTLLLGETSVLKCSRYPWASERDPTFFWYRNNSLIEGKHEPEYTIAKARFSDGANYRCERKVGFRKWISRDVSIIVRDFCSEPMLQADPKAEAFVGEHFKLVCLAEPFQDDHPLLYTFYKNGESLNFPSEKSSYTTEEATLHHSGTYQCEVMISDSKLRKKSNIIPISIKRIPVSVPGLSAHPGHKVVEGDSTSLNCSVTSGSTPIQYIFYIEDEEISWEYSNHSRTVHTIINISETQEGNYRCAVSNQKGGSLQYSKFIAISVIIPVAGVTLTNRANKTEILIGSRLVLECELSRGTGPSFQWYFQQEAFNNASGNYNFSSDRSELAIESFQSQHQGRYQCGAINRAPGGAIFNVTSNFIDLTVPGNPSLNPAQAHSAEMAVLIVPLFLILSLLILLPIKLRNRKQADSSSSSQQHREAMGNRTVGTSEDRPAGNFDYAAVRPGRVNNDSKTDGSLVYSVVTISTPRNAAHSDGTSGRKHADQVEQQQFCITYATLRHTDTGGDEEPGQDEEGNIYANLPRIS